MITFEDAFIKISKLSGFQLIAIDGLPCSGKSTFAERVHKELGFTLVSIDDFYLSQKDWPKNVQPNFPFPFFRTAEFLEMVKNLAIYRQASYRPFDWNNDCINNEKRILEGNKFVVEGCSVLHPDIYKCYTETFFIESDRDSILKKVLERDGNEFEQEWANLFLPSDDIYMRTMPQSRAKYLVKGRGFGFDI